MGEDRHNAQNAAKAVEQGDGYADPIVLGEYLAPPM